LRRTVCFALVVAAHAGLVWALVDLARRPVVRQAAEALLVRLIEPAPSAPEPKPAARPRLLELRAPLPLVPPPPAIAVATENPAAITVAVATSAASRPFPPRRRAARPVALVAARFDADYLSIEAGPRSARAASARKARWCCA
jgi:hypothetical protein